MCVARVISSPNIWSPCRVPGPEEHGEDIAMKAPASQGEAVVMGVPH